MQTRESKCNVLYEVLIIEKFARKHRVNKGAIREWLAAFVKCDLEPSSRSTSRATNHAVSEARADAGHRVPYRETGHTPAMRRYAYVRRVVSGGETHAEGEAQNGRKVC